VFLFVFGAPLAVSHHHFPHHLHAKEEMRNIFRNTKTPANPPDLVTSKEEVFCESPPQEQIIKTAHGDTAVHVYNNDTSEKSKPVIILHGCGGRKEEFQEGRIAPRLASKFRVILLDWYGHGNSSSCPAGYDTNSFLEQLQCVVTELVPDEGSFYLYGFSMGCFLALHFCALYPHRVDRLVLHSPWNGEMSLFCPCGLKTCIRVPLLGLVGMAFLRRSAFPHCHNAATLKRITLTIGQGRKAWNELLDGLKAAGDDDEQCSPKEVLVICGTAEPFRKVAREIYETLKDKCVAFCSYAKASHMMWHDKWDQPVGSFFRDHIYSFLAKE